jgi:CheY-like chemotaxis protein
MKTVLIIENDPDTMMLFEEVVLQTGFNPVCVGEAIDVAYISEINPSLVILDHRLDESFGGDLCREIKAAPITRHIPVLIVSADLGIGKIAEKSNADGYIAKPFDLEDLEQSIKSYLK